MPHTSNFNYTHSVADLGGGCPPPSEKIFLDFMQFSGNFNNIVSRHPLNEGWRPILGKSWIRQCTFDHDITHHKIHCNPPCKIEYTKEILAKKLALYQHLTTILYARNLLNLLNLKQYLETKNNIHF